ncbi:MAG: hypothetical protein E7207_07820 [Clostridium butyricum]|nr:hypothetical protein [Clostridium butyricum]
MGILICGLNGVGKSTIGKLLAKRMSYKFIDNEELYFPKNDKWYEFSNPRSKKEVIHILEERIKDNNEFIFAAVKGDYGEKLISLLDYVILVEVPKETRIERVKMRSFQKFGNRIFMDEDLAKKEEAWFSLVSSRREDFVTNWLENINCQVICIDGTLPVDENVEYLLSVLK